MREHHRNYPYRPFREERKKAPINLFLNFLVTYLMPFKWRLLMAILLVGANACSVYVIAFYGKLVIDNVLAIEPAPRLSQEDDALDRGWVRVPARHSREEAPAVSGIIREQDRRPPPRRPPQAGRRLFLMFILYATSLIVLNLMARMAQNIKIRVGRIMARNLREDTHRKVLDLSLRFHQSTTPGRLLARITSDVEVIQNQSMNLIIMSAQTFFLLVVGFAILLSVNWRIGMVFLAVSPLYAITNITFRKPIRRLNREQRHTNSCLYGYVTQKLEGIKAVQAYAREGLERLNMHRLTACFLRDAISQQAKSATMQAIASVISGATSAGIFLFSTSQALQGQMTVGELLMVHGTVANLFVPIINLTQISILSSHLQVVLGRMMDVLLTPPEIVDAPDARPLPKPLREGINIHNVSFNYGDSSDSEPALKNINLEVPAGTWLCLMGASGSGKSTLLFLLSRLYEPSSGSISYDNVPLPKISMASLRHGIGFVPQVPQIFSGTLRENLTYGKPAASPEEIMRAAKMAELHDFILQMKVQYETIIGERGTSLSGGQRQRLALARALLTNPDILLLDDCTSALDANTERNIQQTLSQTLAGKTAVIASQRVSMACRCHRIAVLENGIVSEFGSHEQLIKQGGFYARLYQQQTTSNGRRDDSLSVGDEAGRN